MKKILPEVEALRFNMLLERHGKLTAMAADINRQLAEANTGLNKIATQYGFTGKQRPLSETIGEHLVGTVIENGEVAEFPEPVVEESRPS